MTLRDDGTWEWEGKDFASPTGLLKGKTYESVFSPLFRWLADHPELYAASTDRIHCNDCEVVEFRFRLNTGDSVVVRYGMGLTGDDFWALSISLTQSSAARSLGGTTSSMCARRPPNNALVLPVRLVTPVAHNATGAPVRPAGQRER